MDIAIVQGSGAHTQDATDTRRWGEPNEENLHFGMPCHIRGGACVLLWHAESGSILRTAGGSERQLSGNLRAGFTIASKRDAA